MNSNARKESWNKSVPEKIVDSERNPFRKSEHQRKGAKRDERAHAAEA
jgi:hypothetical protein